jgi:hypothetical protein
MTAVTSMKTGETGGTACSASSISLFHSSAVKPAACSASGTQLRSGTDPGLPMHEAQRFVAAPPRPVSWNRPKQLVSSSNAWPRRGVPIERV